VTAGRVLSLVGSLGPDPPALRLILDTSIGTLRLKKRQKILARDAVSLSITFRSIVLMHSCVFNPPLMYGRFECYTALRFEMACHFVTDAAKGIIKILDKVSVFFWLLSRGNLIECSHSGRPTLRHISGSALNCN
jgi:hypothetical protein